MVTELNIDALVGPTHHYGGIGVGNVASAGHRYRPSHPRRAALEGLEKAMFVASLGIPQFVLPPPLRPLKGLLPSLGFQGEFDEQFRMAQTEAPAAYSASLSSAFMWAANAATFAPACDTSDGRHHLTLANLCSSWHRLPESRERHQQLSHILSGLSGDAVLHEPLPAMVPLRDEGAANHMRLCDQQGEHGLHLFVYGEAPSHAVTVGHEPTDLPRRFFARQTLAASQAVARLSRLDSHKTFFLQQHPDAIDAGVFHNDVIATSHAGLLLYHEKAFLNADALLARIADRYADLSGQCLMQICVPEAQLSLTDAVQSYLFNSQLLTPAAAPSVTGDDSADRPRMVFLCAAQCERMVSVRTVIENWLTDPQNPIDRVHYVSLDESMSNGGGPACLRLRMQLPDAAIDRLAPRYRLTQPLYDSLRAVIEESYPETLDWSTLASPSNLAQYAQVYRRLDALFSTRAVDGGGS